MRNDGPKQQAKVLIYEKFAAIGEYLNNPDVQEIKINAPGDIWVEERGRSFKLKDIAIGEVEIRSVITLLAGLAGKEAREGGDGSIVEARLPGLRIAAVLSPVSVRGPSMCIRKHSTVVFSLGDLVQKGSLTREAAELIAKAVRSRKNILVSGGTSTGKTTLINAMGLEIPHTQRIVVIEDTQELQLNNPDIVYFEANEAQGITIRKLVKVALRYAPKRIIVGEVRGPEAYDLMRALNSGHDGGIASLHANNAEGALKVMEIFTLAADGVDWPLEAIRGQIGQTFDYVVQLAFEEETGRRYVREIIHLEEYDNERKQYEYSTLYQAA